MRIITSLAILSASLVLLSFDAQANRVADEFAKIAQKNVFRLNPRVRPFEAIVVPPKPPQVSLQGVMTILGPRQVLLKIQTKTKPGTAEVSWILGEGQSREGVTVTRIEVESGTVWLTNQGAERILKIKE